MAGTEYYTAYMDLENRKDRLLTLGDYSKWEINFEEIKLSPEDIAKNKKIAKSLMLPQVKDR